MTTTSTNPMSDKLRRAIETDLAPVRPLPPVWRRTLVVAACATLVFVVTLIVIPLRSDMPTLPLWLSWGASVLELLVGLLLIGLALREAVPGCAIGRGPAAAAVLTALALQVAVGLGSWLFSPGMPPDAVSRISAIGSGMSCLSHDASLALPTFVVTLLLIVRALPLRPSMAGLLGGGGAALTADAVTHLLCPMTDLDHVLVWHSGAIVIFMAAGWALGLLWERLRDRRAASP